MKNMEFAFENCLISSENIVETAKKLLPEIENCVQATSKGYDDDKACISLPDDKDMHRKVKELVQEKKRLNPEYLVVVGIGGSNLGTVAVQEAVLGKLHNQLNPATKVLYADTVDTDYINSIVKLIEPVLEKGGNVVIDCISKSGTTTETAVNFEVLIDVVRKHKRDYKKCVVITSDKDSKLWNLGQREGFDTLEIPEKVGGRYSVLSPVGLFPLGLLGINIDELLAGAQHARDTCIGDDVERNPAAESASIQFQHFKQGVNIFDLFLFSNDLESVGKWNRQLVAESLGKEYNKKGEKVNCGLTPTVSVGSTDLHSIAQLYLGGPFDKFTTFVSVQNDFSSLKVPKTGDYDELVAGIRGKSLKTVMDAILEGTKAAFRERARPYSEIVLPDKSECSVGQFLQFKMLETIYLGYLLGVNPFGQPSVESYKKETRRILSQN
jgi:glucose-6-phosphate isomerase